MARTDNLISSSFEDDEQISESGNNQKQANLFGVLLHLPLENHDLIWVKHPGTVAENNGEVHLSGDNHINYGSEKVSIKPPRKQKNMTQKTSKDDEKFCVSDVSNCSLVMRIYGVDGDISQDNSKKTTKFLLGETSVPWLTLSQDSSENREFLHEIGLRCEGESGNCGTVSFASAIVDKSVPGMENHNEVENLSVHGGVDNSNMTKISRQVSSNSNSPLFNNARNSTSSPPTKFSSVYGLKPRKFSSNTLSKNFSNHTQEKAEKPMFDETGFLPMFNKNSVVPPSQSSNYYVVTSGTSGSGTGNSSSTGPVGNWYVNEQPVNIRDIYRKPISEWSNSIPGIQNSTANSYQQQINETDYAETDFIDNNESNRRADYSQNRNDPTRSREKMQVGRMAQKADGHWTVTESSNFSQSSQTSDGGNGNQLDFGSKLKFEKHLSSASSDNRIRISKNASPTSPKLDKKNDFFSRGFVDHSPNRGEISPSRGNVSEEKLQTESSFSTSKRRKRKIALSKKQQTPYNSLDATPTRTYEEVSDELTNYGGVNNISPNFKPADRVGAMLKSMVTPGDLSMALKKDNSVRYLEADISKVPKYLGQGSGTKQVHTFHNMFNQYRGSGTSNNNNRNNSSGEFLFNSNQDRTAHSSDRRSPNQSTFSNDKMNFDRSQDKDSSAAKSNYEKSQPNSGRISANFRRLSNSRISPETSEDSKIINVFLKSQEIDRAQIEEELNKEEQEQNSKSNKPENEQELVRREFSPAWSSREDLSQLPKWTGTVSTHTF